MNKPLMFEFAIEFEDGHIDIGYCFPSDDELIHFMKLRFGALYLGNNANGDMIFRSGNESFIVWEV